MDSFKMRGDPDTIEIVYTVQQADEAEGLLGIARRLYGDMSRWPEIYEASQLVIGNNPNVIHCGQQLRLPVSSDRRGANGGVRIYVVEPKDTREALPGIARQLYGSQDRWPEIYAINHGVIGNDPNHVHPGQVLIIPQ
jgi:nucleoid-associated protein YgaU